jgi:hypothetical protein
MTGLHLQGGEVHTPGYDDQVRQRSDWQCTANVLARYQHMPTPFGIVQMLVQIRLLLLVLGELRAACMRLSMITVRAAAFH